MNKVHLGALISVNEKGKFPLWGILGLIEAYLLINILRGLYCTLSVRAGGFVAALKWQFHLWEHAQVCSQSPLREETKRGNVIPNSSSLSMSLVACHAIEFVSGSPWNSNLSSRLLPFMFLQKMARMTQELPTMVRSAMALRDDVKGIYGGRISDPSVLTHIVQNLLLSVRGSSMPKKILQYRVEKKK